MESFQRRGRNRFLRQIKNKNPECDVIEISAVGNDFIRSEKRMRVDEAQNYIRTNSNQSILKFVYFTVETWDIPGIDEYGDLAWVLDELTELGIGAYQLESRLEIVGCSMFERDLGGKGKVFNIIAENGYIFMVASYSLTTRSTTCFLFKGSHVDESERESKFIDEFLEGNTGWCQNKRFFPFLLLNLFEDNIAYKFPVYRGGSFDRFDEENLHEWDMKRSDLRLMERDFHCIDDITNYMRAYLDGSTEQGNPDTLPQDIDDNDLGIKVAWRMLELRLHSARRQLEWELKRNDDFSARILRKVMRGDTMASIELAKAGVDLTKAAKVDSSSMKVIAVMTMVFLPGTFIAALFAVPSLDWDGDDVVGKKFWMYWAFAIPFTILVLVLWLAITQRKQMRSAFETSKKQWLAKADALKRRLHKKESMVDDEEQELEEV